MKKLTLIIFLFAVFWLMFILLLLTPKPKVPILAWERSGFSLENTLFFPNERSLARLGRQRSLGNRQNTQEPAGKREPKLKQKAQEFYRILFEAEDWTLLSSFSLPILRDRYYSLLTYDLNRDGKLEIIVSAKDEKPRVLDHNGVFKYELENPYEGGLALIDLPRAGPLILETSQNSLSFYFGRRKIREFPIPYSVVSTNVCDLADDLMPELLIVVTKEKSYAILCYDLLSGRLLWSYDFSEKIFPLVWAFSDMDEDGVKDLVGGGITEKSGYFFVLTGQGKSLWQFALPGPGMVYTRASVSDLDNDGRKEIVGILGNDTRDAGRILVFEGTTGEIIARYPVDQNYRYAFTSLAIGDRDEDGKTEIFVSASGKSAQFLIFSLVSNKLITLATKSYYPFSLREHDFVSCQIEAVTDINGDDRLEVIGSLFYEKKLSFREFQTKPLDPNLVILDGIKLKELESIELEYPVFGFALSYLHPKKKSKSPAPEILLLTDRLLVFTRDAEFD